MRSLPHPLSHWELGAQAPPVPYVSSLIFPKAELKSFVALSGEGLHGVRQEPDPTAVTSPS